jgi:hypothetical protein
MEPLKTPVRRYSLQLSEASLFVLHGLVGRAVSYVYAPCLQVDKRHLTAQSISIPTSDQTKDGWVHRYVIVRCEWFETPETRTDYWQLFVDNEDKPSGIEFSESKGIVAPCTINFYGYSSPILKVRFIDSHGQPRSSLTRRMLFMTGQSASKDKMVVHFA